MITPSESLFFSSLVSHLNCYDLTFTAADSAETIPLLELQQTKFKKLGSHPTSKGLRRQFGIIHRTVSSILFAPYFDLSLSFTDFYAVLTSVLRRRPSISMTDNDKIENKHYRLSLKRCSFVIFPEAMPRSKLMSLGMKEHQLIQFPGYKEDIYIADYVPNPHFALNIPFTHYVVLRPEALFASYVDERHSITSELCSILVRTGFNVLFLPRNHHERTMVKAQSNVFVPEKPLNGLDLCWHADAVLTGSGTMAREAALLGIPAVSFFPGTLLSVDQDLVEREMMYHSRDPKLIAKYLTNNNRTNRSLSFRKERSAISKAALVERLKTAIESCLE